MKCTIPGPNVKIFGRAIHSLSKLGDELYMEPLDDSLSIRTVNSSRSAYACFSFKSQFFIQYTPTTVTHSTQGDEDEAVRCKITMKSCLTVFKSLSSLDKTVDKCKIHLDMKEARLVFQLYCKHGIVKTHNLSYIECESLQAVFTKDLMPNALTAPSRLFSDAVVNFQNNQEEITLSVNPSKVSIKNYIDDEPDPSKCIRSELSMDPEEFDDYQIGVDTEVTFCLKELRAILSFSEPSNLPISAHFEGAGKPLVLSIDGDTGFEGDFVLATLAENSSQNSQQSTQTKNTTVQRISTIETPRTVNKPRPNVPKKSVERTVPKPVSVSKTQSSSKLNGRNGYENSMSNEPVCEPHPSTSASRLEEETSPVIPACSEPKPTKERPATVPIPAMFEGEDSDDDMLPGTPPAKKFKSLFFGLSQSTTSGSQTQVKKEKPTILAEDTDEDD